MFRRVTPRIEQRCDARLASLGIARRQLGSGTLPGLPLVGIQSRC